MIVPEIVGGFVFTGAVSPRTVGVALDAAVAEPSAFFAVTSTRRRRFTSCSDTSCCCVVASAIVEQSLPSGRPPDAGQRTHWYEYDVGLPVQSPRFAASVAPTRAPPRMRGSVVFVGAV